MEEIVKRLKQRKTIARAALIVWLVSFVLVGASLSSLLTNQDSGLPIWLTVGLWFVSLILFIVNNTKISEIEKELTTEVAPSYDDPAQAVERLVELGVRRRFAQFFLKEEIRKHRMRENDARHEAMIATAKLRCKEVLGDTKKPNYCNKVNLEKANDFFDDLDYLQARTTWEVWRSEERLCFYAAQIKGYPSYSAPGPYAFVVNLSDIQYFRVIGSVKSDVQISGGTVKQDKRTGKVTQTPLKTRTVERDERLCDLTLRQNGVIFHLQFDAEDFDVFFALIPEKEYHRVTTTSP